MILATQLHGTTLGDDLAGLVDALLTRIDEASHDQRLGASPAFGESTLYQSEIGALLHAFQLQAVAGTASASLPSAASAIAVICGAFSPAWSYCFFGFS